MYLDFYSLKEIPFSTTPPLGKVLASKNRKEILDRLLKEINKNGELKVLISEKGSGKTTLVLSLIESISDEFYVIPILKPAKTPFDLLKQICANLGIPFSSLPIDEIVSKILAHLKHFVKSDKKPLLILDNAHVSSKNIFELLQNFFRLNKSISNFLRVLLVGEPILEEKLFETSKKFHLEKNWSAIQLTKLNFEESKKYINHRLQEVKNGWRPEVIFTEHAIKKIVCYSNGNPRKINIYCNNALVLGYLKSARKIDGEIIDKVKSDDVCLYEIKKLISGKKSKTLKNHPLKNIKKNPNKISTPNIEKRIEKTRQVRSLTKLSQDDQNSDLKQVEPIIKSPQKINTKPPFVHLNGHSALVASDLNGVIENILISLKDQKLNVIGITSPIPRQGSSTIALEISKLLMKRNSFDPLAPSNSVLFVDANFQNPLYEKNKGLAEIASNENENIDGAIAETNLNFSFISTGQNDNNLPLHCLKKIETYFHYFKNRFEFIVVDLPPVLAAQKSVTYAKFCDGIILVVQAGKCKWEIVEESKKQLEKLGVTILGSILNRRKFFIPNWLYKMV